MSTKAIRTTLALPEELLAATDEIVRRGKARSRNEFISTALRHELANRRRAEIDAAFAAMGDDEEERAEARAIAREFEEADWEALVAGERLYQDGKP